MQSNVEKGKQNLLIYINYFRWNKQLDPKIKKEPWTLDEEKIVLEKIKIYGTSWVSIAKYIPGRTNDAIKNHWNSSMKHKYSKLLKSLNNDQIADKNKSLNKTAHEKLTEDKENLDSNFDLNSYFQTNEYNELNELNFHSLHSYDQENVENENYNFY